MRKTFSALTTLGRKQAHWTSRMYKGGRASIYASLFVSLLFLCVLGSASCLFGIPAVLLLFEMGAESGWQRYIGSMCTSLIVLGVAIMGSVIQIGSIAQWGAALKRKQGDSGRQNNATIES